MKLKRQSGVLLAIRSLPSDYAIGDLGPAAYAFIDYLKAANQKIWQILPINPTDGINSHSPYASSSAFAGNRLFISPEILAAQGLLTTKEIRVTPFKGSLIDYPLAIAQKDKFLSLAYQRALQQDQHPWRDFVSQQPWLEDYALFVVLKNIYKGVSFDQWPKPLLTRHQKTLAKLRLEHQAALDKIYFEQWMFFSQWINLKAYANQQGISIVGDIPIYVSYDSADVWCHPSYFQLDSNRRLKFVSGCPPDYFSKTGQRWGNPTYNWATLKAEGYRWWCERINHNLSLFDYLRIDHFRGFCSFWQIPAHEKLAIFGQWVKGPGKVFFSTLKKSLGNIPIIAEDLGEITPDVVRLMKDFDLPGMRVLLFAFGGDLQKNPHVPLNYHAHMVAYTGTHDNNTVQGWYHQESKEYQRAELAKVLGVKKINVNQLHWQMIESLFASKAGLVIIPMQDILGAGVESRMNTPATQNHNWQWRLSPKDHLTSSIRKLLTLNRKYQRND